MFRLIENKKYILFMEITYFPVMGRKAFASFSVRCTSKGKFQKVR